MYIRVFNTCVPASRRDVVVLPRLFEVFILVINRVGNTASMVQVLVLAATIMDIVVVQVTMKLVMEDWFVL